MNVFAIAICDDDPESQDEIVRILQTHPEHKSFQLWTYSSGEDLCRQVLECQRAFDLIILDIRLKAMDGVRAGELLRQADAGKYTSILFISADTGYAMSLFDLRPLNFLIKPIPPEKLLHSIDAAIALCRDNGTCFAYQYNRVFYKIPYYKILYFESKAKQMLIHCTDTADPVCFYGRIGDVAETVSQKDFLQIHYSFIVNWIHVKKVMSDTVMLDSGTALPISRGFRKSVQEKLIRFLGKE